MARAAIAGLFILAIACGVGFGVASADSSDDLARAGAFGFDESTHIATLAVGSSGSGEASNENRLEVGTSGQLALEAPATREIDAGLAMIDEREALEEQRVAEENAAAVNRVREGKAKQGIEMQHPAQGSEQSQAGGIAGSAANATADEKFDEYNLPAVDWSVGKKAFVAEWSSRIDAYLADTPLEGYGSVFADASWESGVDPRWSPAISNTESGNGRHCFLSHNAWGWGNDAWPDWDTAIRAHVAGLADGYGYSLTFDAARKYCPPNCVHWYNNTLGQMNLI